MFETILVPLDGSELAEEALAPAAELGRSIKSRLILVQAVESLAQRMTSPPVMMESPGAAAATVDVLQKAVDAEKEAAQAYLGGAEQRLKAQGINVEAFVAEGSATEVILALAQEKGAGLIIMSSHGRGGLGRLVFGSVADAVLRRSEVPMLVVRSKGKTEA